MATASLSTFDAVLKTAWGPAIKEQLNNKNTFLERIQKETDSYDFTGKNFTFPVHVSRNEGVGSRLSNGALPTAGSQGFAPAVFPRKYSYGTIKLDRAVIVASQSNEKAFARALATEMKGLLADLRNNQDRQLFNDGLGTLATCVNATGTTTVVVDSTRNLRVGQAIDICVAATGAESYGKLNTTVASITNSTTFVTGDALTTYASLDSTFAVYAYGNHAADNSLGYEPYGLSAIIAATDTITGGFGALAVASYPVWKSTLTDMGGATTDPLTLLAMDKILDDIDQAGNGTPSAIITTHGCRRAYGELMNSMRQIVNMTKLDGGKKTLTHNDLPFITDKYCQAGTMWFPDESDFVHLLLQDWEWAEDDGAILKWVSGYDQVTAYMCKYDNMACYSRNAHGKLSGITEA